MVRACGQRVTERIGGQRACAGQIGRRDAASVLHAIAVVISKHRGECDGRHRRVGCADARGGTQRFGFAPCTAQVSQAVERAIARSVSLVERGAERVPLALRAQLDCGGVGLRSSSLCARSRCLSTRGRDLGARLFELSRTLAQG